MKCTTQTIPIQQLPSGDWLNITAYKFHGSGDKKIYIQANIHGPELTGILVAHQLISFLKKTRVKAREITIVPSCNPMALNAQILGQQVGYVNQLTGMNWNRIYPRLESKKQLKTGLNKAEKLEDKLGYILMDLSWDADIVIDLHTAWGKSPHYVYCFKSQLEKVKTFGVENIFVLDDKRFEGVFDEAHNLIKKQGKQVYTLELGSDCSLDKHDIESGLAHILSFLKKSKIIDNYTDQNINPEFDICQNGKYVYMYAPAGGLLVWMISPGSYYAKGQQIAQILKLDTFEFTPITANMPGKMMIQFNARAVHKGQAICKVMTNYLHETK